MPRQKPSGARPSPAASEPTWVRGEEPTAWSPPTPWFREEPWRRERKMTPEEVAPLLAELKAVVAAGQLPEKRRRG